ncbi:death-associated inhibitor of apoptosis 1-like [Aphis craccivora]|uniref:Death-associated inhibitor of apoptosis 1-like n=1 Tax=Aphis craccivora TaxID=307492 RepID=A0A6G0YNY0_APHCR|nr:death-associated inhibitor of apoptosis 1-like [Aphis craccivora]
MGFLRNTHILVKALLILDHRKFVNLSGKSYEQFKVPSGVSQGMNMNSFIKSTVLVARKHVKFAGNRSKKINKNKPPRAIRVPKMGGSLTLIPVLAGLSALDTLAGGVANIVRTIRGIRSNVGTSVHLGKGVYLRPYKSAGSYTIPQKSSAITNEKNRREIKKLTLPNRALYDFEISEYAKRAKISHFRGVYCIDRLPVAPRREEAAVVNLDFEKIRARIGYAIKKPTNQFCISTVLGCDIEYNYERKQAYDTFNCGHLSTDMASQTVSLSGNSSELECHFFPPLELTDKSVIGLLSIQTYNSIPNVEAGCDTLHITHGGLQEATKIKIPTGCYEIITLETKIRGLLKDVGVNFFSLSTDNSTLKCTVHCNNDIDLNAEDIVSYCETFTLAASDLFAFRQLKRIACDFKTIIFIRCIKIAFGTRELESGVSRVFKLLSRLKTFGSYPTRSRQDKYSLAECGFTYTGADDLVQCHYCGILLGKWEENYEVWQQHSMHNPECVFVLLYKGAQFIENIKNEFNDIRNNRGNSNGQVHRCKTESYDVNNYNTITWWVGIAKEG